MIDYDLIFSALTGLKIYDKPHSLFKCMLDMRDAILNVVKQHISDIRTVWIITAQRWEYVKALKQEFNAQMVIASPGYNECLRRLANDDRRGDWELMQPVVAKWYDEFDKIRGEVEG